MIKLARSIIGNEEKRAVEAVLDRAFLGMGPEVQAFEKELEDYLGSDRRVLCVNTGTSALHLALQAIGLHAGDEVLVPSLTFVATFQAISATGANPVACDVDEKTWLLDLEDAERRLTAKTKAIVPVHYASEPGNVEKLYQFAKKHGLRVVEDAAHSFGCEYKGRRIGSFGDITCFSFDGIKNITSGEGGAVVTSDPQVIAAVADARLLGVCKDSEKRYRNERSWEFDVTEQGWRYHMSDIMAAIGRVQLRRFESEFRQKRMELASIYRKRLSHSPYLELIPTQGEGIVPFMVPVRIRNDRRDAARAALLQREIEVGIHYKPSHLLSKFGRASEKLPVAEAIYRELLSLPLHPGLSSGDVEEVCQILLGILSSP